MKSLALGIILLFVGTAVFPSINSNIIQTEVKNNNSGPQTIVSIINESMLDLEYIYNITRDLSYIIFTEYNESAGELAKGRFFGTKGEWRAAEILYDNMTELGLWTTKEQIKDLPDKRPYSKLTHKQEILDFGLKINDVEIEECYIAPKWIDSDGNIIQSNNNFSFKDLKIKLKPDFLRPILDDGDEDYVFIEEEWYRNPNASTPPSMKKFLGRFIHPYRLVYFRSKTIWKKIESKSWKYYPHCKGVINYDFNSHTHNMVYTTSSKVPTIYITGLAGRQIIQDIENASVDFFINQTYNESVISYNVIGQLNGTDPSKTVIVDCLYDGWWCQGTGDSAIGMATVLGIAKYFTDNNIKPKYNIKFIGFGGEEQGCYGARSYEYYHRDENIIYVIDLNQIGFKQEIPRLTLNLFVNKLGFMSKIWNIAKKTDYKEKTNDLYDIKPAWFPLGGPSDDQVFTMTHPLCKTVCFLKGPPWAYHHRDGMNHTEGDVMKYFDWDDVNATGKIVLNVVKHLTVKP